MVSDRFADLFSYLPSRQTAQNVVLERHMKYLAWLLLATAAVLTFVFWRTSSMAVLVFTILVGLVGALLLFCVKMGEPHLRHLHQIRNVQSNIIAYRRYPNGQPRYMGVRGGELSPAARLVLACAEAPTVGFITNTTSDQSAFLLPAGDGSAEPIYFRASLLYLETSSVYIERGVRYYLSDTETWEGPLAALYQVIQAVVRETQPGVARNILENATLDYTLERTSSPSALLSLPPV